MNVHDVQKVRQFEHPGAGRKRAKATPKGRQVDPTAAHEIELLLGDRPRRRDLLIEHLHLIQDKYHQISAAHLAALADEMKLSFAEVFEFALPPFPDLFSAVESPFTSDRSNGESGSLSGRALGFFRGAIAGVSIRLLPF